MPDARATSIWTQAVHWPGGRTRVTRAGVSAWIPIHFASIPRNDLVSVFIFAQPRTHLHSQLQLLCKDESRGLRFCMVSKGFPATG
ncbi:hypothetical protein CBM2634_A130013 [Cupriavidus taiwanensis]|uniref:Uncharacterized protein n=1 Tax=Cupriavidus taiwanensis TaxID=164546 RepID=A0A375IVC0_9BURK|nr:hypothetical protein CBM2634_A130013 [Cupriavidus taiwanensis]